MNIEMTKKSPKNDPNKKHFWS